MSPDKVLRWHRKGFRLVWSWKIRHGMPGRLTVPNTVRDLIRNMSRNNPISSAPRIHGELLNLGIDVGETSVSKYMIQRPKEPSQKWRILLDNYLKSLVSVDFFTVPSIRL